MDFHTQITDYSKLTSTEYLQIGFTLRQQAQELRELKAEVAELRDLLWEAEWKHKTKESRVK